MTENEQRILADSRYRVPNLERGLEIMECLVEHPEGLGITELTELLEFSKNSVFRITMTLLNKGYLQRDENKRFTLTRKLLAMGCEALTEDHLMAAALDIMHECRDRIKETILIGTLVGDEGVVMEQVLGSHPFKFSIDLGHRIPIHTAAPGKAIMAYLPEAERERLLDRLTFTRFNENTITSKRAFKKELESVLECGYAVDRSEQLHGICCIGAPVFDRHGQPVAAIWTTGPEDRVNSENFENVGRIIREHADRISERLGYGALSGSKNA